MLPYTKIPELNGEAGKMSFQLGINKNQILNSALPLLDFGWSASGNTERARVLILTASQKKLID